MSAILVLVALAQCGPNGCAPAMAGARFFSRPAASYVVSQPVYQPAYHGTPVVMPSPSPVIIPSPAPEPSPVEPDLGKVEAAVKDAVGRRLAIEFAKLREDIAAARAPSPKARGELECVGSCNCGRCEGKCSCRETASRCGAGCACVVVEKKARATQSLPSSPSPLALLVPLAAVGCAAHLLTRFRLGGA